MDIDKIMDLEVAIVRGADFLDRKVGDITMLLEDELPVPPGAVASVQEDISILRKHLDDLEHELTATT